MELQSMTLCYLRKLEHRCRFGKSHTTKSGLAFLVQGHLNPVFPVPFGTSLTGGQRTGLRWLWALRPSLYMIFGAQHDRDSHRFFGFVQ